MSSRVTPLTIPPDIQGLISITSFEINMCVVCGFTSYSIKPKLCSVNDLSALATPSVDSKSGLSGKNSTIASDSLISSGSAPIFGMILAKSVEDNLSLSIRFKSSSTMLMTGILDSYCEGIIRKCVEN